MESRSSPCPKGSVPVADAANSVGDQYNQEPAKVASIVLVGNLTALVLVPLGLSIA